MTRMRRATERLDVRVLEGTHEAIERLAREHGVKAGAIIDEAVAALHIRIADGAYCKHPGCFAAPLSEITKGGHYDALRGVLASVSVSEFASPYCTMHVPRPVKAVGR